MCFLCSLIIFFFGFWSLESPLFQAFPFLIHYPILCFLFHLLPLQFISIFIWFNLFSILFNPAFSYIWMFSEHESHLLLGFKGHTASAVNLVSKDMDPCQTQSKGRYRDYSYLAGHRIRRG